MPGQNRIDLKRGVQGAAIAAAVGLGSAAVAAFATPYGILLCPAIYSMCVCAGWIAYAPTGKQRLTSAIAGLLLVSWIAMDAAAVTRPGDLAFAMLVTVGAHVLVAILFTAIRATQIVRPT